MTSLENHARKNQLYIKIIELKTELAEREMQEAQEVPLLQEKLTKLNEQYSELLRKKEKAQEILADLEKNRHLADTGRMVLQEAKDTVRHLSVQVEGQDLNLDLLNKQLSTFNSADDLKYLRMLADNLKKRRGLIFKRGRIDPDAPEGSDENKKGKYKLGKKIGRTSIPIH